MSITGIRISNKILNSLLSKSNNCLIFYDKLSKYQHMRKNTIALLSWNQVLKVMKKYNYQIIRNRQESNKIIDKSPLFWRHNKNYTIFSKSFNGIFNNYLYYDHGFDGYYYGENFSIFNETNLKMLFKDVKQLGRRIIKIDTKYHGLSDEYSSSVMRAKIFCMNKEKLQVDLKRFKKEYPQENKYESLIEGIAEEEQVIINAFTNKYDDVFKAINDRAFYISSIGDTSCRRRHTGLLFSACETLKDTKLFYEILWTYNNILKLLECETEGRCYLRSPGRKGRSIGDIIHVQNSFHRLLAKFQLIQAEIPRQGYVYIDRTEENRIAAKHKVNFVIVHSISRNGAYETALEYTAIQYKHIPKYQLFKIIKSKGYRYLQ